MRTPARILTALALAAVAVVGTAYLLPREADIRATRDIAAPPASVYSLAADLGRFAQWSPWPAFGPEVRTVLSGAAGAVGQTLSSASDDPTLGSATLVLTALEPDRLVATEIDLGGADRADTVLGIAAFGGGSRVTWALAADLGDNPLGRYLFVLSGARLRLERQLANGLARLAARAEVSPGLAPSLVGAPIASPVLLPPIASSPLPPLAPFPAAPPALSGI